MGKREVDERVDFRVQKWLAAREVVLSHADAMRLCEGRLHLRHGHERVAVVLGSTTDKAVQTRDVTNRPRDLKPKRVERSERERGRGAGVVCAGRGEQVVNRQVVHRCLGYPIAPRAAIGGVLAAMLALVVTIQPVAASAFALGGVDGATDAFALAARVDQSRCRADDIERLDALLRDAERVPEVLGDLWMLRTFTLACLGDRRGAAAAAERAASLHPAWRGVAWRYLGHVPVDWLDAPLWQFGPGALDAWEDALAGVDEAARAAQVERWDAYAPTTRLAAPLEALAWRVEPNRHEAVARRLRWIRAASSVTARAEKALELMTDDVGIAALEPAGEALDIVLEAAAAAARAQDVRRANRITDRLTDFAILARADAAAIREVWDATAKLSGRRADAGRRSLERLAQRSDRVGVEARWALLIDARRRDADAEAYRLTEDLLAMASHARRIDALEACVHLAGAHGSNEGQASCLASLRRASAFVSSTEQTALAVEVAVDALAVDDASGALAVLESAPMATVEREYWRGHALQQLGDAVGAAAAFEEVRQLAPLSYYALQVDAVDQAGSVAKFATTLRTVVARRSGGVMALDAPAARLLALGMPRTARRWGAWSAQLAGSAVPEAAATAAVAHRSLGESGAALWLLQRHASISEWPRDTLERVGSDVLSLAWPRPYEKAFAGIPSDGRVSSSLLRAFARRESSYRADAVSSVGARGLLQVLSSTAHEVTRRAGWSTLPSRRDLLDPQTSVGVAALALEEWHADPGPCLAPVAVAYAAGPGKVRRWLRGAAPLPSDLWLARMPYPTVRNYAREVETASVSYAVLEGSTAPRIERCLVGG